MAKEQSSGGWLSRWRAPKRQEQQLATLREGFNELVDLTRAIREHMEQQARTQQALVDMMDHIPGAVEGLKSVGQATAQQTETLNLLKKQLEAAARNENHLVNSMDQFNKTLNLMDNLSKSTSQTVASMADRTRDSEEMLRLILERSERRLIYLIVALGVAIFAVLGAGLYFGVGQRPDPIPAPVEQVEDVVEDTPFTHQKSITELGEPEEAEEPDVPAVIVEDEAEEMATDADAPGLIDEIPEPLDEMDVEPVVDEPEMDGETDPEAAIETDEPVWMLDAVSEEIVSEEPLPLDDIFVEHDESIEELDAEDTAEEDAEDIEEDVLEEENEGGTEE